MDEFDLGWLDSLLNDGSSLSGGTDYSWLGDGFASGAGDAAAGGASGWLGDGSAADFYNNDYVDPAVFDTGSSGAIDWTNPYGTDLSGIAPAASGSSWTGDGSVSDFYNNDIGTLDGGAAQASQAAHDDIVQQIANGTYGQSSGSGSGMTKGALDALGKLFGGKNPLQTLATLGMLANGVRSVINPNAPGVTGVDPSVVTGLANTARSAPYSAANVMVARQNPTGRDANLFVTKAPVGGLSLIKKG